MRRLEGVQRHSEAMVPIFVGLGVPDASPKLQQEAESVE
jgi:hypothetical protein